MEFINTILEHWETILAIVGGLIAIVRLTAWGKANKEALDKVTEVVEQVDAKEVKASVQESQDKLGKLSSNALSDSVRKADKKKESEHKAFTDHYLYDILGIRARKD